MKMEVYGVDSEKTGKLIFVGAWEDAYICWKEQKALLEKGNHPNIKLQEHFNKYGEDDLVMTVVKKVNSDEAVQKEIELLKDKPKEKPTELLPEQAIMPEVETEKAIIPKKSPKKK